MTCSRVVAVNTSASATLPPPSPRPLLDQVKILQRLQLAAALHQRFDLRGHRAMAKLSDEVSLVRHPRLRLALQNRP